MAFNLFDFGTTDKFSEMDKEFGTPAKTGVSPSSDKFAEMDKEFGFSPKTTTTEPSMSFKENVGGGLIGGALGVLGAASELGSYINPMRYLGGEDNSAKAGAEFGKSLKPAFERQAKKAGYDPESFGAKLGETAPSFLVPMGGYLGAAKGAATLGRAATEAAIGGGLMGAVAGAGESGTVEGAAKGIIPGAVGGAAFGALGHGISKLPELLIGTGIGTPSKLLNASERLKKLGAPEYSDASAASKWLLDKGIAGNLEQRAEKLQSVIDDGMRRSSELLAKDTNVYNNQVTASIRQALREMLPNFAKVTEKGIQPKAGTEDVVNTILELGGKEGGMTLDQINRARTFIADTANIFRTSGDMTADASKLGLQNVWKNASKFIEKTAPGFRAANKDVEVGIALKDAVALKQSQDMTRQIVTLMNAVPTAAGASYGAVNEGGVEGALKGAAAGFALKKGAEFVFSPANASRLAVFIDRLVGGQGKRIAEALKKAQEKGIPPEPEIMAKLNEALSKSASSAPVAPVANVKTKTVDVSELTPTPPVRQSSVSAERPNRRRPGGTETTRRLTRGMEGQRPGKEVVTKQRLGERRPAREGAFQEGTPKGLAEEAKKYKTADEFFKNSGFKLRFHQTSPEIAQKIESE